MKPKTDNEILHGNSKSKGVRVVSFTTSKHLNCQEHNIPSTKIP